MRRKHHSHKWDWLTVLNRKCLLFGRYTDVKSVYRKNIGLRNKRNIHPECFWGALFVGGNLWIVAFSFRIILRLSNYLSGKQSVASLRMDFWESRLQKANLGVHLNLCSPLFKNKCPSCALLFASSSFSLVLLVPDVLLLLSLCSVLIVEKSSKRNLNS